MRKKVIDFVGGMMLVAAFLAMIGSVGAYELDNIGGGQCIVQAGCCLVVCVALVALNSALMERVERGLMR